MKHRLRGYRKPSQACSASLTMRVDRGLVILKQIVLVLTVRGGIGLLKYIESVALILSGRALAVTLSGDQSSVFSFDLDTC